MPSPSPIDVKLPTPIFGDFIAVVAGGAKSKNVRKCFGFITFSHRYLKMQSFQLSLEHLKLLVYLIQVL